MKHTITTKKTLSKPRDVCEQNTDNGYISNEGNLAQDSNSYSPQAYWCPMISKTISDSREVEST